MRMCVYVFECVHACVCMYVAVNSHACYRWIVNDITDCKTCLFYVSGLFVLFCFSIVCVQMCVYFGLVRLRLSVYVCVFT